MDDAMDLAQFVRAFEVRAPNIMWLLGAGASASGGVATAGQMIWQFRLAIYCSTQNVPVSRVGNLADPATRSLLAQHFARDPQLPGPGDEDEYSALFELAYPSEADRQAFIARAVAGAKPSFGHLALGALMDMGKVPVVWTTNFDGLVEDAAAQAFGSTSRLTVAQIETAKIALDAVTQSRWPLLGKLHGDFRSTRLKNTIDELQAQDALMRQALQRTTVRFGLAVVGYSGRDDSVMGALGEALDQPGVLPHGLFWFHRGPDAPAANVTRLLSEAQRKGVQAHLLRADTFDELFDALLTLHKIPEKHQRQLDELRPSRRRVPAQVRTKDGGWPLIRLNALPVLEHPTTCRRIACDIGGTAVVRKALEPVRDRALGLRRRDGVIAFGFDGALRQALAPYGIEQFDLADVDLVRRGYQDSADLGLLYEALLRALERSRPLTLVSWRQRQLIVESSQGSSEVTSPLRKVVGRLDGTVPATTLRWAEAVHVGFEYRMDRLWLVYEPTVWVQSSDDVDIHANGREFGRERRATRYNKKWNELLHAWEQLLAGDPGAKEFILAAFAVNDRQGVDATFRIERRGAYSRKARS